MSATRLARPEIAAFKPYVTAVQRRGTVRLNANESSQPPPSVPGDLNRYPAIRPDALQEKLAAHFGVDVANLVVTRGSSEAIDLLVRTFCQAYRDSIVTTPPTFSMYKVYANMQAAKVIESPLGMNDDFQVDAAALLDRCGEYSKLIFLCSPNNPTGSVVDRETVMSLANARAGRSLVVVDEAYIEFSDQSSLAAVAATSENIVVLRTLSKASALAGARCGAVIASAEITGLLSRLLPPYAFSTPTTTCLLQALQADAGGAAVARIAATVTERQRLREELAAMDGVRTVWPSHGNFLLVRFTNLEEVAAQLDKAGILIRLFHDDAALDNCARITIGTPAENDALLASLRSLS